MKSTVTKKETFIGLYLSTTSLIQIKSYKLLTHIRVRYRVWTTKNQGGCQKNVEYNYFLEKLNPRVYECNEWSTVKMQLIINEWGNYSKYIIAKLLIVDKLLIEKQLRYPTEQWKPAENTKTLQMQSLEGKFTLRIWV